jgi:hypothetical protein
MRLNKAIRNCSVIGVLTLAGVIPGCSSNQPNDVTIKHDDPLTGHTEGTWHRNGPEGQLPPGWRRTGTRTVTITVDGKTYTIILCIATDPDAPNCIYINSGGCENEFGWTEYCKEAAQQLIAPGDLTITPEGGGRSGCPDEQGTINYDELSGKTTVEFKTGCDGEPLANDLVNVSMAAPGSNVFVTSSVFYGLYGGVIPAGTTIKLSGDQDAVAWDAWELYRSEVDFTTTDHHRVGTKITSLGTDLPPVVLVVYDGKIQSINFVVNPN